jgi:CHAD domain-containing protein
VRDLDVLLEHIRGLLPELDRDTPGGELIVAGLEEERAEAQDTLLDALASERYLRLLDRFSSDLERLTASDPRVQLVDIAASEAKRLRKAHAGLGPEPADDRLHKLRIKGKRARYAAELASGSEGKPLAEVVKAVKRLQDVVGSNQDAVVAEARVRALARARSGIAAGRIVAAERARRQEAQAALPKVWKRVERALKRAF